MGYNDGTSIAAAKELGADETGKTFLASFKAIAKHKRPKE
jgi:hypothetical protein